MIMLVYSIHTGCPIYNYILQDVVLIKLEQIAFFHDRLRFFPMLRYLHTTVNTPDLMKKTKTKKVSIFPNYGVMMTKREVK